MADAPLARVHPDISIEDAATVIADLWTRFKKAPDQKPLIKSGPLAGQRMAVGIDKPFMRRLLLERTRDCGWCAFFTQGPKGLDLLLRAAVRKVPRGKDRDTLERVIDRAFYGIGDWLN